MTEKNKDFPEVQVRAVLKKWWEDEKAQAAELAAEAAPQKKATSVLTPIVEIDSHRAVRAILELEPVVGFEIPGRVIKLGGYESFEAMVEHLVSELRTIAIKKQEKTDA